MIKKGMLFLFTSSGPYSECLVFGPFKAIKDIDFEKEKNEYKSHYYDSDYCIGARFSEWLVLNKKIAIHLDCKKFEVEWKET